ncbi:PTS transporter subunit EIIC [Paenibacillus shenyangensis]|uniref:PTS transporter subunit EIIC n=1 Tax=Paenibacillus sp. A9 TaxID=1284352 RepID=UPI0003706864|nr:PTS transporter subunit EIIC [Paenibacillus sp. A9]
MPDEPNPSPSARRRDKGKQTRELASLLIERSGGPDNVLDVVHCTTRIRFKLKNNNLIDEAGLHQIREVQNINRQAGQLQIIVGPELVYKVHRQITRLLQENQQNSPVTGQTLAHDITDSSEHGIPVKALQPSDDSVAKNQSVSTSPVEKQPMAAVHYEPKNSEVSAMQPPRSWTGRMVQGAAVFSDILLPILPLFIAAGILLGLVSIVQSSDTVAPDAVWLRLLQLLTSSAFQVISALFGYHAAKRFGGTPAIGAVLGIAMSRPDLGLLVGSYSSTMQTAGTLASPQFSYQGSMIPIIVAALVMALIEKGLRRILPAAAATLLAPGISLITGGALAILVIGPAAVWLGEWVGQLLEYLFMYGGTVFGFILGGIYSTIVLTGLHQGIQAIEVGLISDPHVGVNFLLPIWSMANMAQGGAGLAVYLMSRSSELRKIALSGSITAFLGITEPIALGVNLKLGRPFLGAAIGGAVGGAYVGFHHVVANSFGLTGIPMLAYIIPFGEVNFVHYMIGFLLAAGTAFVAALLLGVEKPAFRYHLSHFIRKVTGGPYENQKDSQQ